MSVRVALPDGRTAGALLLARPNPPEIKPPFAQPQFLNFHEVLARGKGPPVARLTDQISHLSLLAMLALAAAVIVVVVAVVAVIVLTGGAAVVMAAGVGATLAANTAAAAIVGGP